MKPFLESFPGSSLRDEVRDADASTVREIVSSIGFFHPPEVDVAVELVTERLAKGLASGYHFLFVERSGRVFGYAAYGPIPCSVTSWDIYWIAVRPELHGKGLGRALVVECEKRIRAFGGTRIYIDTSSRREYDGTRAFYEACGYLRAATLDDFYDRGDGKVIYSKIL